MRIKLKKPQIAYLTIHGHFYQPPRENPWVDIINAQESAKPFHNWNERITHECYLPNCYSKIIDNKSRILNIVNNFEYINFNIGPTLFQYIEKFFPKVYQKIIDADKRSMEHNNGFGNAISQVYNHIIMPLANRKDKITQIKWGIQEFEYRFRRQPESMWLSETAVDYETAVHLMEAGIKYIILAPHQAEKFRHFDTKEWTNNTDASIPTHRPYRLFKKNKEGEKIEDSYLDIFFYNGKLSHDLSFGDILFNSDWFADAIVSHIKSDIPPTQLVSIATDGEVYGHHKKFSDMCLASLIKNAAPNRGIKIVNFSNYLDMYPPTHEVVLASGSEGLGTSWSCAHGVGRWFRDCGCNSGGGPNWSQKWRSPLRKAFDELNKSLNVLFEFEGKKYFKNIYTARDEYIALLLDNSYEAKSEFFKKHLYSKDLLKEQSRALRLLEIQKFALFMYTSCGWFFSELTGIETLQNMKYAAKAINLASHFDEFILSTDFYSYLEEAKSNIDNSVSGRDLYQKIFKESLYSEYNIINEFAHKCLFLKFKTQESLYNYNIDLLDSHMKEFNSHKYLLGKVRLSNKLINEEKVFIFYLIQQSINNSKCWIMEVMENFIFEKCPSIVECLNDPLNNNNLIEMFPNRYFSIKDILFDTRLNLAKAIFNERNESLNDTYSKVYKSNIDFIEFSKALSLTLPKELKAISENVIKTKIKNILKSYIEDYKNDKLDDLYNLINNLIYRDLVIESESLNNLYLRLLYERLKYILEEKNFNLEIYKHLNRLIDISGILKIEIQTIDIIDLISFKIDEIYNKLNQLEYDKSYFKYWDVYLQIFKRFNFNTDRLSKMIKNAEKEE